jgi:hypothetical protein
MPPMVKPRGAVTVTSGTGALGAESSASTGATPGSSVAVHARTVGTRLLKPHDFPSTGGLPASILCTIVTSSCSVGGRPNFQPLTITVGVPWMLSLDASALPSST